MIDADPGSKRRLCDLYKLNKLTRMRFPGWASSERVRRCYKIFSGDVDDVEMEETCSGVTDGIDWK